MGLALPVVLVLLLLPLVTPLRPAVVLLVMVTLVVLVLVLVLVVFLLFDRGDEEEDTAAERGEVDFFGVELERLYLERREAVVA